MVVSGYEYHKRTDEPWCNKPDAQFDGMSYQEYLHSVNEHDGLMAEISWVARSREQRWPNGTMSSLSS